jgi:hypothetical protein
VSHDTSMAVRDGADVTLPFDLKITELVPNADGAVRIRNTWLGDPDLPFDPKPADNTARLVLNDDGSGSEETGGTSEGASGTGGATEGSAGGDTAGQGSGTSGTSDASSGSGPSGSTGSSGTASASTDGGLASTGSVALMASGGAVIALAVGGVLYATNRRRARQA